MPSQTRDSITFHIDERDVAISSPDKLLWPDAGFTKRDLAEYYIAVADALLPHVADRPLTFKRAPGGVAEWWWYQTECPHPPPWVTTVPVPAAKRDRVWRYCVVNDTATLLWLANLGCLELHPLLVRQDDLARPTAVVFDLDPGPGTGLLECCAVALRLRDELTTARLTGFVKTSGAKGMHVFVPLAGRTTFDETRSYARTIAARLAAADPTRITDRTPKEQRAGKVLIDWQQNGPYRSLAAPYSLRLLSVPLVSMPLDWEEVAAVVEARDAVDLVFSPNRARARLAASGDPWNSIGMIEQAIS